MNYLLKMMDGSKYPLTHQDYLDIATNAKRGEMFFIKSIGVTINSASISSICPENYDHNNIDRSKQFEGVLTTGELVVKRFGEWFLANGERDDNGNPCVRPNPDYYPELRSGLLPTPAEYEAKYKDIPSHEWPALLAGNNKETPQQLEGRSDDGGFTKLIK